MELLKKDKAKKLARIFCQYHKKLLAFQKQK